jgi:hypothetical protein
LRVHGDFGSCSRESKAGSENCYHYVGTTRDSPFSKTITLPAQFCRMRIHCQPGYGAVNEAASDARLWAMELARPIAFCFFFLLSSSFPKKNKNARRQRDKIEDENGRAEVNAKPHQAINDHKNRE